MNAKDSSGSGASKKSAIVFDSEEGVERVDLEEEKTAESNTTPEKTKKQAATPEGESRGKGKPSAEKTPGEDKKPKFSPHTKLLKTEPGIKGARIRDAGKRKRESGDDPIADSMDRFTQMYSSMGARMLEVQRDIANNKAETLRNIAKDQAENQRNIANDKAERDLKLAELEMKYRQHGGNWTEVDSRWVF